MNVFTRTEDRFSLEPPEMTRIIKELKNSKALDKQIGGDWYKNMAIQPLEFTHKNNLNFCQGNIIKYACRYKKKNGIEDLKKVIHYAELLIQMEYGDE